MNSTHGNNSEKFYIEHNYVYFNDTNYYKYYNFKTTEPELPEWYNTDRDNEIVHEFVDESDVFYDENKSIETEIKEYNAYVSQYNIEENDVYDSLSDSDGEWTNV